MQTHFSEAQLQDPATAESEAILRKCVHCGFCNATCPTYTLLGDELDSPRGRIYLIKDMFEQGRDATAEVATHVDRCLSCLSCTTTCPSGVDYRRLVDRARSHIEQTYRRPLADRAMRALLAAVLPYPGRFRITLRLARLALPFRRLLPRRLRAMLELAPAAQSGARGRVAAPPAGHGASGDSGRTPMVAGPAIAAPDQTAVARSAGRVAVLTGCVQSVMGQSINAATIRLLERIGFEVVTVDGCCGSIVHHLGREAQGTALAASLVRGLIDRAGDRPFDAIVSNASGCGTQLKDLAYQLRHDAALAPEAAALTMRVRDVTEVLAEAGLPARASGDGGPPAGMAVAYHSACSIQHGQRLHQPPRQLLAAAGYDVREIRNAHLCCGSAGTYNMLQPEIAARLGDQKLESIVATGAGVVAAGNLGCLTQLDARARAHGDAGPRFVHTVELLDWATGGPRPAGLG